MESKNIIILFSGNGSNLENIYKKMHGKIFGDFKIQIPLAISNNARAYGITRCKDLNLNYVVLENKNFDFELINILKNEKIDLVVLAGFMRILGEEFCKSYKTINIHPSILPLFKGANALRESFESYMKIAGVSVHFVNEILDSGELIAQDIIQKINGENFEDFKQRIHALEHRIYPKAILEVLNCKI